LSLAVGNVPVTKVVLPEALAPRIAPLINTLDLFLGSMGGDKTGWGFGFLPPLFVGLMQ
jgi:hypothetical protein